MKKLTSYEIRKMWLDFFSSKQHQIVPSASLIPVDDPTLLWINAGVAPLKKYFDGREIPSNPRLCNAQKSIRTNDIDNVGKTARHHTFFEMLGNFSIGDYFRDYAIEMATELLFDEKWYGFDKDKIYITYYPEDQDTYHKWLSCGVGDDHLIPLEDNFWEIGEGPCGPDTEIFYDRGDKYDPNHIGIRMLKEDIENDRYIEIWNIVLSQFNSQPGVPRSEYNELPSKNIDTGSGLERLACIFQETETNYETDLFMPMIKFLEENTHHEYMHATPEIKMSFRVIVDHIRSVSFAIADGAILSNEGRGYVLRRILRRAVRYGKKLGINKPFLYEMVKVVVDNMKAHYTYLTEKQSIIEKIIKTEEENFLRTLESGEKKLQDIIEKVAKNGEKVISGNDAFLLYDTFGFPIELTVEVCEDNAMEVNMDEFNEALKMQKERARNARTDQQSMNVQNEDFLKFKENSSFIGYNTLASDATVIGLFKDGKAVNSANGLVLVVLDKTPFYALSGGQMGDQGEFIFDNKNLQVYDTFKLPNKQHAHVVETLDTTLTIGDHLYAMVDEKMHFEIACNHSATHLLNQSLREVLGNHVVQQGSQVTKESLRFDFNNYQNLTNEEILKVEKIVNDEIKKAHDVVISETSVAEAKKVGAQAEFGEKYGDVVRLVNMDFSKELCGGTHVSNTSVIENFAITSIESKGSGIFRAEGSTNVNMYPFIEEKIKNTRKEINTIIQKIKEKALLIKEEKLNINVPKVLIPCVIGSYQDILNFREALDNARKVLHDLEKEYDNAMKSKNAIDFHTFMNDVELVKGTSVILEKVSDVDVDMIKDVIDNLALQYENCLIMFAITADNKVTFIAKAKGNNFHCGQLVKAAALATNGNGGGRPDFAQAGGKDPTLVEKALETVHEMVSK